MVILTCKMCGHVADLDAMTQVVHPDNDEYIGYPQQEGYCNRDTDLSYIGFYCPVCKQWVYDN